MERNSHIDSQHSRRLQRHQSDGSPSEPAGTVGVTITHKPTGVDDTTSGPNSTHGDTLLWQTGESAHLSQRVTTFVFDFDGTIADTESVHFLAYNDVLSREFSTRISLDEFKGYVGKSRSTVLRLIKAQHEISFDDGWFVDARKESFRALLNRTGIGPFSYFLEHLEALPAAKRIVLSAQDRDLILLALGRWDLTDAFAGILTTDDVHGKRAHLDNLRRAHAIDPASSAYFEDSLDNLEMGGQLGFATIGVQTLTNQPIPPRACAALIDMRDECMQLEEPTCDR